MRAGTVTRPYGVATGGHGDPPTRSTVYLTGNVK